MLTCPLCNNLTARHIVDGIDADFWYCERCKMACIPKEIEAKARECEGCE